MAMKNASKGKRQRAEAAYERFLHILKWTLIVATAYVALNVGHKVIWNAFHPDGSLSVKDGVVQAEADDLIVNHGTQAAPRYFAYARVSTPSGYTRRDSGILNDHNETDFLFLANNPEADVDQIYVAISSHTCETAATAAQQLFENGFEACVVQPIATGMLCDTYTCSFSYQYIQDDTTRYGLNVYFDTKPYAVVLSLTDTEADKLESCLQSAKDWLAITRK